MENKWEETIKLLKGQKLIGNLSNKKMALKGNKSQFKSNHINQSKKKK